MTDVSLCLSCARGFTDECTRDIPCGTLTSNIDDTNVTFITNITGAPPSVANKVGRPVKENAEDIKDPFSTGRKRAATLYPLDRELPCEWREHINCGGGKHPIAGCTVGLQENLHHGPDKNTLSNQRSNIHKICSHCHNRWHAANDHDYDDSSRYMLHAPVLYSEALALINKYLIQQSRDNR